MDKSPFSSHNSCVLHHTSTAGNFIQDSSVQLPAYLLVTVLMLRQTFLNIHVCSELATTLRDGHGSPNSQPFVSQICQTHEKRFLIHQLPLAQLLAVRFFVSQTDCWDHPDWMCQWGRLATSRTQRARLDRL